MKVFREGGESSQVQPKFYTFRQNNSGGGFAYDENAGISVYVIVEATSPADANNRAQSIGVYFDGCEKDMDCSCCGDRWYEQGLWGSDSGYDFPTDYGTKHIREVSEHMFLDDGQQSAFVHYMNGRVEGYGQVKKEKKKSRR